MLIIKNYNTDPYFNLAAEEYLLKQFDDDIFTLWRNDNAIIVGKHQNTLAEINVDVVNEKNIKVIRRLSGGGTVFHDLGNLNFTFITNAKNKDEIKIDFKFFTLPIIEVLKTLGVNAEFSGRNDLLIDGMKISGNAEHIYHQKKRTLHHGTLLYASQIADLSAALKVNPLKFEDKAVKSVRSRVTNISSHMPSTLTVETFYQKIIEFMASHYKDVRFYEYTDADVAAIEQLANEKYKTWEWNFGYSPKYTFKKSSKSPGGFIEQARIHGDFFNAKEVEELEQLLIGCPHNSEFIRQKLSQVNIEDYITGSTIDHFLEALF